MPLPRLRDMTDDELENFRVRLAYRDCPPNRYTETRRILSAVAEIQTERAEARRRAEETGWVDSYRMVA